MKKHLLLALVLSLSLIFSAAYAADEKAKTDTGAKKEEVKKDDKAAGKAQTTCPVMAGNPINKKLFVDKDGKRIYVCCKACIEKVKKDFDAIAKKLEADGITLAKSEEVKADSKKTTKG